MSHDLYQLCVIWYGRVLFYIVGKSGQSTLSAYGSNLDSAKSTFTKKCVFI